MSFGELILFAFVALMVFGPKRLPEIARTLAKVMAELRRAGNEFRYSLEDEVRAIDRREREKKALPPAPAANTVAQTFPERPASPTADSPAPPEVAAPLTSGPPPPAHAGPQA